MRRTPNTAVGANVAPVGANRSPEPPASSSAKAAHAVKGAGAKQGASAAWPSAPYVFALPSSDLKASEHFSSLLFGGSVVNTVMEVALLVAVAVLSAVPGVDTQGSIPLRELAAYMWVAAVFRRFYNTYLETVYFTCPQYRTQPPREHALKQPKDLCGRDLRKLEQLHFHDKLTLASQVALDLAVYWLVPGFYPSGDVAHSLPERVLRLVANHYVLSFGMYWTHRALHASPFLWRHIHSFHHWARHPLSRNTYEDHWFDNFMNAVVGHFFAQVLVPLDRPTFYFSRFLRMMESLEKHSGVSCHLNLAHTAQRWLPFAQMPHHHDWHHEGHKGCNYTFAAIGGLWDCVFNTRKAGRFTANGGCAATARDLSADPNAPTAKETPHGALMPVAAVAVMVGVKLAATGCRV